MKAQREMDQYQGRYNTNGPHIRDGYANPGRDYHGQQQRMQGPGPLSESAYRPNVDPYASQMMKRRRF